MVGVSRISLTQAVDLYLAAYQPGVEARGGRGDTEAIMAAQEIDLGQQNAEAHRVVQQAVHEALAVTLGFDFSYPANPLLVDPEDPLAYDPGAFGNVRLAAEGSTALLQAVRAGLGDAIANGDPREVEPHLLAFWDQNPDFEPHHSGRYYPHGHEGEEVDPAPQQIEALTRIAERLLDLI